MKLEFLSFDFDKFATEMQNLKDQRLCLYPREYEHP